MNSSLELTESNQDNEVIASFIHGNLVPPMSDDHDCNVRPSSPTSKLEAAQNEIEALT